MTINEKNEEYRKKYWNPKWASLTQEEKLNDPEFSRYIEGLIKMDLEYFKEQKTKMPADEADTLVDYMIGSWKQTLKHFSVVE